MMQFILNILSILSIITSIIVIISFDPIISVLYLIILFFLISSYLIILGLGIFGLVYIILYVGAIIVLFLFVIIILNLQNITTNSSKEIEIKNTIKKILPIIILIIILFLIIIEFKSNDKDSLNLKFYSLINYNIIEDIKFNNNFNLIEIDNLNINIEMLYFQFNHIETIGFIFYTINSIWLILISFILILAIIGPITLTKNKFRKLN